MTGSVTCVVSFVNLLREWSIFEMPDCKRNFSLNFLAVFLSGQSYVASQKGDDDHDDVMMMMRRMMMMMMVMMMKGTETTACII